MQTQTYWAVFNAEMQFITLKIQFQFPSQALWVLEAPSRVSGSEELEVNKEKPLTGMLICPCSPCVGRTRWT